MSFDRLRAEYVYKTLRLTPIPYREMFNEPVLKGIKKKPRITGRVFICSHREITDYHERHCDGDFAGMTFYDGTIWINTDMLTTQSSIAHVLHHELAHYDGWWDGGGFQKGNGLTYEQNEYAAEAIACMISDQVGIEGSVNYFHDYVGLHVTKHPKLVRKALVVSAERIYNQLYD